VTQKWAATFASLRKVFAIERLGPPVAPAPARRGRGFLRILFAIEPLPRDVAAPPRRRRGWLRFLFAMERLDSVPVPRPAPRRSRWLRWLLAPEPLDPP
jgi:hypothetical protein